MYLSEVYACANRSYTQISITYLLVVIFYFLIVWIVLVFIFKYEGADRNFSSIMLRYVLNMTNSY